MPFTFKRIDIDGLIIVEPGTFHDGRGFFMETYRFSNFCKAGIKSSFIQDNQSSSTKGVLRGLHYQLPPFAQGKLVRVIEGAVWDVAVDIRSGSPTFGKWHGIELSAENHLMFYLPPGFAHGFVTLTERAQFMYKCTAEYSKECEAGIRWDDTSLAVKWPIKDVKVSEKDSLLPPLVKAPLFRKGWFE